MTEADLRFAGLLAGRVVAVTGGSRSIGRAVADRILAAGGSVVAASRSGAGPVSGRAVSIACDVTDDDAPERILTAALDRFGHIHGLVNNAGLIGFDDCWRQTDEHFDAVFATNLTAPFRISQRIARHWVASSSPGVIVNMCSVESDIAFPRQAAYSASKGGLLGLTRAMALDLAPYGIRVAAIGPGSIDTPMTGPYREESERRIPLGRLGEPREIGDTTVFLLSDLASYVTGTILYADGGYSAL